MKIVIGNKEQKSGYFELGYTFTLDVPQTQQTALSKASETVQTTVERYGVAGYKDGTELVDIQNDLIARFNKAQEELNSEKKLEYFGMSYDGKVWA